MHSRATLNAFFAVQLCTLAAILFDIPFARQVLGFVFLSFVPGFLIWRLLGIKTGFLKTVLFSAGISLVFLMFFGLLLNTMLPIVGISNPISTSWLVLLTSSSTLVLFGAAYSEKRPEKESTGARFKFPPVAFLLVAIPFLAVLGAWQANAFNYTFVLWVLVPLVCLLVFLSFSKRLLPKSMYPLALFSIALFLLIGTSLVSNYLVGVDVQTEAYFAQLTSLNSAWDATFPHPYNGMLSVTVLPSIYTSFMNLDVTWVFKLGYPLLYALVPLALYLAYKKQTNGLVALLAVFFFMSMDTFYLQMLGLARQMIGELFFALIVLLLAEKSMNVKAKRGLVMVFGAGLIVSHYALAYLFVFYLLVTLAFSRLFKRPNDYSEPVITPAVTGGFIAATLGWNLIVSPSSFNSLQIYGGYVFGQIMSLAPSPGVSGLMPTYLSPIHELSKYIFLAVQGLILVGFLGLLITRKKSRFSREYSAMSTASLAVLIMTIAIPSFATAGLNVSRFYHIALFLLAPLCITGAIFIARCTAKIKNLVLRPTIKPYRTISKPLKRAWMLLMAVLLVSFFLFQVGFVYEVVGDPPTSFSLSKHRMSTWTVYLNELYIIPQEINASTWLSTYEQPRVTVFGDFGSKYLSSYGLIRYEDFRLLDPAINGSTSITSYFHFSSFNLAAKKVEGMYQEWNLSDFSFVQKAANKIYSNGETEIYYGR